MKQMTGPQLTEADKEKETILSLAVERQATTPCRKNLESLFLALKDAFVYVPVRMMISEDQKKLIQEAIGNKTGQVQVQIPKDKLNFAPLLFKNNNTNEKVMAWFSRQADFVEENKTPLPPLMRFPVKVILDMAENIPEAFEIMLDMKTHPVKLTIDEILAGLDGEIIRYEDEEQ